MTTLKFGDWYLSMIIKFLSFSTTGQQNSNLQNYLWKTCQMMVFSYTRIAETCEWGTITRLSLQHKNKIDTFIICLFALLCLLYKFWGDIYFFKEYHKDEGNYWPQYLPSKHYLHYKHSIFFTLGNLTLLFCSL